MSSYTPKIGEAGQKYMDTFKHAHPLPGTFRWQELWDAMSAAVTSEKAERVAVGQVITDPAADGTALVACTFPFQLKKGDDVFANPPAHTGFTISPDGFGSGWQAGPTVEIHLDESTTGAAHPTQPAQADEVGAFEAWAESQGYATLKANGAYLDRGACHAWFGWRAARSALTQRPAAPDLLNALRRLHDWAQAMSPNVKFTGDHPIAIARATLPAEKPAAAAERGVQGEPVAEVRLMMTGGNVGIATRIVALSDELQAGDKLYLAPPIPPAQAAEPAQVDEVDPDTHRVQEEADLLRAIAVMEDTVTAIEDWEDQELGRAIESSLADLRAIVETIRMQADPNYVPGDVFQRSEAALTQRPAAPSEVERLRAEQAIAVMPLIGPLLDAWEWACRMDGFKSDHSELHKQLRAIDNAMEGRPAAPLATDAGVLSNAQRCSLKRAASLLRSHADTHPGDIIDAERIEAMLAAHPAAERPAQGEAVAQLTPVAEVGDLIIDVRERVMKKTGLKNRDKLYADCSYDGSPRGGEGYTR